MFRYPEGEVDPGPDRPRCLWDMMFIMILHGFSHKKKASMRQRYAQLIDVLPGFMSDLKIPRLSKCHGCNGVVLPICRERIAVPGHGVIAIPVIVQQHAVEAYATLIFYFGLDRPQHVRPFKSIRTAIIGCQPWVQHHPIIHFTFALLPGGSIF